MHFKPTLFATLAYTGTTFPLAIVWHVVLFKAQYQTFGYFTAEPNFILGLLTILIQGFILSLLYPYVAFSGTGIIRGLKYALLMGGFFWTSHVLAFVAKQAVNNALFFILIESVYLSLQFGIYGILLGLIFQAMDSEHRLGKPG